MTETLLSLLLTLGFSGLALFLAAVGIYGVLAYLVTQRTKEIGIRMAVGCGPTSVFGLVQREGLLILAVGLVLGLASSLALSRYVQSLLFGVQPLDPGVLVSSSVVLGVVAFIACSIPAIRATRINPVSALSLD